jgi:hypothetical protein
MDSDQTINLTSSVAVDGHGDCYSIDLSDILSDTSSITLTPFDANITGNYSNLGPVLTINDSNWANGWNQPSGHLSLKGDDADIDINGVSLMDTIRGIQDRLNILCPDPEMEKEWDQLREIREQYEAKLQECREKSRAWKALQQSG